MDRRSACRWVCGMTAALLLAAAPHAYSAEPAAAPAAAATQADGQQAQAKRELTQPGNNSPFWRDVRDGDRNPYQTTQVRGIQTSVLVQTEGEVWRQLRNGPITVYGGWLLVVVFLLIGLFYWWKGPLHLHAPPTGRQIQRFTSWERIVHWTTAISFSILAVSGLILLFGRYILLPATGYTLFSWLAALSKNLHNFVGPLFVVCTVLMFITFVRNNVPRAHDWVWARKLGGLLSGEHVPSGKFNAGEKVWFWFGVITLGLVVGASGLVLNFPNFGQGRELMQFSNVIHAISAILFMAMSLGHIYIGTIGADGAYDSMRYGMVDETWAKEHHEYWYQQMMAERATPATPGMTPTAAPASAMKEGWKT